jgi:hypothetical protein
MWFRNKESDKDIEMSGMMEEAPPVGKKKKPSTAPEETEYLPFDWKRVFFSAKYLRKTNPLFRSGKFPRARLLTRGNTAWHILFILIGIATVIITIKHDEVVEVCCVAPSHEIHHDDDVAI